MMARRASRRFYRRDSVTLARALLGQRLVRVIEGQRLSGLIVETEAYLGIPDQAAHTFGGRRTARNETMWGDAGHVYVYFTYGLHHCVNVVAGKRGDPIAVLIRGLEPCEGLDLMRRHREKARRDTDLCSGPAKLCQALAIDRTMDGFDLIDGRELFVERVGSGSVDDGVVVSCPRIGVDYAGSWADKPLRFYLRDNPHVSRSRA